MTVLTFPALAWGGEPTRCRVHVLWDSAACWLGPWIRALLPPQAGAVRGPTALAALFLDCPPQGHVKGGRDPAEQVAVCQLTIGVTFITRERGQNQVESFIKPTDLKICRFNTGV